FQPKIIGLIQQQHKNIKMTKTIVNKQIIILSDYYLDPIILIIQLDTPNSFAIEITFLQTFFKFKKINKIQLIKKKITFKTFSQLLKECNISTPQFNISFVDLYDYQISSLAQIFILIKFQSYAALFQIPYNKNLSFYSLIDSSFFTDVLLRYTINSFT
ncbi:hypothetical protein IMG5_174060, partial [Ichthyophthirius multifiliis]